MYVYLENIWNTNKQINEWMNKWTNERIKRIKLLLLSFVCFQQNKGLTI